MTDNHPLASSGIDQALSRAVFDAAPDALVVVDDAGIIQFVNAQTERLFGYAGDILVGRPVELLVPTARRESHRGHRARYRNDPEPRPMGVGQRLEGRRADGTDFPVEISLSPVIDGDEQKIIAAVRDVTDRTAAERKLRASEAAFRAAFDAAPVGMAIAATAPRGRRRLLQVNQTLCDMLGFTQEQLLAKTTSDITHPDDREADEQAIAEMLAEVRTVHAAERRYLRVTGGERWVWLHATALEDADGNPDRVLVHIVDLTEKRKAENLNERDRQRIEGLAEVRAAALNDAPVREILELVVRHARRLLGCESAFAAKIDAETNLVHPISFDSETASSQLPTTFALDPPIVEAIVAGHTSLSDDLHLDQRFDESSRRHLAAQDLAGPTVLVPIETVDRLQLLLFLGSRRPPAFDPAAVAAVETFAKDASTALQLSQANRQQSRIDMLEDRERLARDLHDVVIQQLFGAGMGLQAVQSLSDDIRVTERIGDTVKLLDQTIAELRTAIFNLNSPTTQGAAQQIGAVIDRSVGRLGFRPRLSCHGNLEAIPERVLEQLLPTLTEALSNAARHADATEVDITVTVAEFVQLVVADNGVGLDPTARRGSGLDNIESRAAALNGSAAVESNLEGGTTLTWTAVGLG